MARILAVAQQKGGAGKTTVVVQLATTAAKAGRRVVVVDIDPQASLTAWMRVREHEQRNPAEIRLSMIGGWRLPVELDRLRGDADLVLVDTPPHAETDAKVAIRHADLVIVPMQPSAADFWASRATFAMALKEKAEPMLLLNRVPPRARSVEEVTGRVQREGWPMLNSALGNRQSFVTSFARGLGVIESEPSGTAAIEVRALTDELRL